MRSSPPLALLFSALLAGCASPIVPARAAPAPPVIPSTTQANGFFAGTRGDWLFTQSWLPRTRERAVLVVVHGLKDHSSRYAGLAGSLGARGIAVESFDLRGHGHSAGVRVDLESFGDYVDDLDLFVARVRTAHPNSPLFVLGHSMGGAITTTYILKKRPPVQGFILSAPAIGFEKVGGAKIAATRVTASLFPSAGVFQLDTEKFSRDPAVVREAREDPLVHQPGAPARTARELISALEYIDAHMEDVTTPFLALHGTADEVTEPAGSKALHARARSTDKNLTLYPGLAHDLLHEPERARVTDDIAAWIEARSKGHS